MYYYSFNKYLRQRYGTRVRRLSLNAGFTCPNRDEDSGKDGCIFCNELGFSRFAETKDSLKRQIDCSMTCLGEKSSTQKFIAYFQNAAGTNAQPDKLKAAYDVIKGYPQIVGLSISTRPDCVDEEKLDLIASYAPRYEVWVEYGLQTVHDRTLEAINRRHTFSQSVDAIIKTAQKAIKVGVHVILGLPGESGEDMIATAQELSRLPVSGVKLHALHVLKDTEMERLYRSGEVKLMSRDEYVRATCDFLENLNPDCVVLRLVSDAKKEFLVGPGWINDKLLAINMIEREFAARGTRQGSAREVCRDPAPLEGSG
ncbi:TIGR01212 family radical SAM protein [Candidatus Omnitrophota bacterium]